jgi:hypothetical protein
VSGPHHNLCHAERSRRGCDCGVEASLWLPRLVVMIGILRLRMVPLRGRCFAQDDGGGLSVLIRCWTGEAPVPTRFYPIPAVGCSKKNKGRRIGRRPGRTLLQHYVVFISHVPRWQNRDAGSDGVPGVVQHCVISFPRSARRRSRGESIRCGRLGRPARESRRLQLRSVRPASGPSRSRLL